MVASLVSKMFHFVLIASKKHNIDDSHGLSHSMNVLQYANKIYDHEIVTCPSLKNYEKLIYVSAILHDMCDKKYMDEETGLKEINLFLQNESVLTNNEMIMSNQIMSTMSYSKVKKYGYPIMGSYQNAYHVVREADLLSAYDFDRCIIYQMNKNGGNMEEAFNDANNLFDNRVLKHIDDGLFISDYSKKESAILHNLALQRINSWKQVLNRPAFNKM